MKKKVTDELRARMSAMAKRRLVTMSKAKRYHIAYMAGIQGGRPVRIDHAKVRELRAQGSSTERLPSSSASASPAS